VVATVVGTPVATVGEDAADYGELRFANAPMIANPICPATGSRRSREPLS
jgi:hypothetical protein